MATGEGIDELSFREPHRENGGGSDTRPAPEEDEDKDSTQLRVNQQGPCCRICTESSCDVRALFPPGTNVTGTRPGPSLRLTPQALLLRTELLPASLSDTAHRTLGHCFALWSEIYYFLFFFLLLLLFHFN